MFQLVNSGSRANTDNADTLREAFHKINNNFIAISSGSVPITGSNVSSSYALTASYALNSSNNGIVSRTVLFSPTSSNAILTGVGSQSDMDNASVTFTGGNSLNVFNLGNLKLTQLTHYIAAGVNLTSTYTLSYPEPSGKTSITSSQFPFPTHFNNSYVNGGVNDWTISNSNATMSCQKTGLTLGSQITVKVLF